jgi:hypothetical protein
MGPKISGSCQHRRLSSHGEPQLRRAGECEKAAAANGARYRLPTEGGALADAWPSIASAAIMPAGGVAVVGLGLFQARNEQQFLLDFLRDTIAAREA